MEEWFPADVREEDGRLTSVPGYRVAEHRERLATLRGRLLQDLSGLTDAAYRRQLSTA
jgi:hypothetical protein